MAREDCGERSNEKFGRGTDSIRTFRGESIDFRERDKVQFR